MRTWPMVSDGVFKEVTWKLCEMLENDHDLREACKDNRQTAKDTLKAAGKFDRIPDDVEVFIMENNVAENSKVVTIILPKEGKLGDEEDFEAKAVWNCSWHLYPQLPADPQ
ncbi:MAG: hypothetical protein ABI539_04285 [Acidobacteriota bacterium]